ncbi:MAG TPA: hypothetical protein VMV77_13400, partial [Bacteroidales bacterium]|nr:hypothetical protein [Bacteroidales bacterium]
MKALIITYNRLFLPAAIANFLFKHDIDPVFVDNNSDYPPLLEYYKETSYQVVKMDQNYGYKVVWDQGILNKLGITGNYIVTDPDLDLSGIPDDFLKVLEEGLRRYPQYDKCGFSLEINDLPPTDFCPAGYEKQFWQYPLDNMYFKAAIDTTFALYKVPYHSFNALRTNRPYIARHLPWYYYDFEDMPEDEQYYFRTTLETHSMGGIFR